MISSMMTTACKAMLDRRWDAASKSWWDTAERESHLSWAHPISVSEKFWLAQECSLKAGDDEAYVELGERALRTARGYLDDIPDPHV